jgi:hypothetical protein
MKQTISLIVGLASSRANRDHMFLGERLLARSYSLCSYGLNILFWDFGLANSA